MTPLATNTTARALRFQSQFDRCLRPQRHYRTANDATRTEMAKAADQARRDARRMKTDRGVAK